MFYPESSESSKILKKYDYTKRGPEARRPDKKWLPEEYKEELRKHFRWELEMFGYEY